MTPKEYEQLFGVTVKAQARLRERKEFPFPYIQTGEGTAVRYSIYEVAKWLLSGHKQESKPAIQQVSPTRTTSKRRKPVEDASHFFQLQSYLDYATKQQQHYEELVFGLTKLQQAQELELRLLKGMKD